MRMLTRSLTAAFSCAPHQAAGCLEALEWVAFSRPQDRAQCLARALAAVVASNDLNSWRELLLLPKAVLRTAPRGGAARRQQAASFTLRGCQRWLAGEMEELWDAVVPRPPRLVLDLTFGRSFKRGTAAGASGLRADHCDEVAAHLTQVVQLLARGEAPAELAPNLAAATLHALPKNFRNTSGAMSATRGCCSVARP